ncbi:MAG: TIGR03032 family protein [Coraliomargarita sp.]|nr:TIGR03032 family protein [Coraliomargarita sp.]
MAVEEQNEAATNAASAKSKVEYSFSDGLLRRLSAINSSLAFTSYQSGLLYMLGASPKGGAQLHQSAMPKPMGLFSNGRNALLMSSDAQLIRFENVLNEGQRINQLYDACFMPRVQYVTGQLDAHDVGFCDDGELVFVNTRYNCLSTVSERFSFKSIWKPPFISEIVDEDRCHLNGLAMRDGEPAFVTAVSRSNTIDGWRDRRVDGGVVVDVGRNEIVCEGLSMPHSPRWYDGRLWVLNSGTGELGFVGLGGGGLEEREGFNPVAFCPGFLRGLAIREGYAFVGLSRPRYKRFEGLALDKKLQDADSAPWCGVQVIELSSGTCVDWFRIDGEVAELYDLELIDGVRCPMTVSPSSPDAATLITFE